MSEGRHTILRYQMFFSWDKIPTKYDILGFFLNCESKVCDNLSLIRNNGLTNHSFVSACGYEIEATFVVVLGDQSQAEWHSEYTWPTDYTSECVCCFLCVEAEF